MKLVASPGRVRLACLVASTAGLLTFIAAQEASGRAALVFAAVSLSLFLLEVVLGIIDGLDKDKSQ